MKNRAKTDHLTDAELIPGRVFVALGTSAWRAWEARYQAANRIGPPVLQAADGRRGWYVPTKFPLAGDQKPAPKPHWTEEKTDA